MPAGPYRVELTRGAEADLEAIHDWLAENRAPEVADDLLNALLAKVETLEHYPERGSTPKELEPLGMTEFRQTVLPPYRLIYRIIGDTVAIMVIADGRRDMETLLRERLLRT